MDDRKRNSIITEVAKLRRQVLEIASSSSSSSGDVTGPAGSTNNDFVTFNGATGKIIKDSGLSLDTDITLVANSDLKIASQKAVKAYADAKVADTITDAITTVAPSQNAVFDALALKQPLDSDLTTIAGLTATTDNFIVSVASAWASRTPAQVRTTLALVIGTDVEAHNANLTTIAGLTPTNDDIIQRKLGAWTNRTMAQLKTDLVLVKGDVGLGSVTNDAQLKAADLDVDGTLAANSDTKIASQKATKTYADTKQPLDTDLTTIAALTATTDNFIVSVASAWASRTPAQVRTTLGLVVGTDVEAHNSSLTTIAGLTPTNDDIIQRKAGAWTNRTMAQLKTDLVLVKGDVGLGNVTNDAQLKAADLDNDTTLAADSATKIPSQHAVKTYVTNSVAAAGGGDMLLAGVQTVTGAKTFNDGKLVLAGATSGTSVLKAAAVAGSTTLTLPGGTDTLAGLAAVQTITGAWSFNDGKLILNGVTSGNTTLKSGAVAGSSVITLPVATDTLVGKATTDTLTNKTLNSTTNTNVPSHNYWFEVYAGVTNALGASGFTKILFNTEENDPNNNFATSTYTIPVTGTYQLNAAFDVTAGGVETYIITIYKNSVEFKRGVRLIAPTGTNIIAPMVAISKRFTAGDTIEIYGYNGSGGGKTVSAGQAITWFNGHLASL